MATGELSVHMEHAAKAVVEERKQDIEHAIILPQHMVEERVPVPVRISELVIHITAQVTALSSLLYSSTVKPTFPKKNKRLII